MLELIARRREGARTAFIPYIMAGDPDLETTEALLHALTRAGAACIELGVPYGDPLADGPTIAAAGQRALAGGTRLAEVLALVERVARDCAPILLFTYFNPLDRYGLIRFADGAQRAGAAGAIVPDLPLEESETLRAAFAERNLAMPLLIAPTTPLERAQRIAAASTGFVYVVARLGVTGADDSRGAELAHGSALRTRLAALRALTEKPLAVGFGVANRGHVAALEESADAIIVGSALLDACAGLRGAAAGARAETFARELFDESRRSRLEERLATVGPEGFSEAEAFARPFGEEAL